MIASIVDTIKSFFKSIQFWTIITPWEQGVRVRFGKWQKVVKAGTHFKIPIFDKFFVQSVRMRISSLPKQTISTLDGKTITLSGNVSYCINDIEKLYNTMSHVEDTINSMARGIISQYVFQHNMEDCQPARIEKEAVKHLDLSKFGLGCDRIYITDFAVVKTYRLIGEGGYFRDYANINTEVPIS